MLRRSFLQLLGGSAFGLRADVNNDGRVDMQDLAILSDQWLKESTISPKIAVRQDPGVPILVRHFDDVSLMSDEFSGTVTVSDETTHVRYYNDREKRKSVALIQPAGQTDRIFDWNITQCAEYPGGGIDWENVEIEMTFYIPPEVINRWSTVAFWIQMKSGSAVMTIATITKSVLQNRSDGGWFSFRKTLTGGVVGTRAFLDDIDSLRIRLFTNANDTSETMFILDRVAFIPAAPIAHYAYTADDGCERDYDIARYLKSKGLRGTFGINGSFIGNAGRLTLEQMQEMQSWGMLFINHSYAHLYPTREGGEAITPHRSVHEMKQDLQKGAQWLIDNGFPEGAHIWMIAGSSQYWRDWDNDPTLCTSGISLIRLTNASRNDTIWDTDHEFGNMRVCGPELGDATFIARPHAARNIVEFNSIHKGMATEITTHDNHGFQDGNCVYIDGTLNYNGYHEVTVTGATSFTIPISYLAETSSGTAQREDGWNMLITDGRLARKPLVMTLCHNGATKEGVWFDNGQVIGEHKAFIDRIAQKKVEGKLTDITLDQLVLSGR